MTRRLLSILFAFITLIGAAVFVLGAAPSEAAAPVYTQLVTKPHQLPADSSIDPFLNCPKNYKAISGGALINGNHVDRYLSLSEPSADVRAWVVVLINNSSTGGSYTLYADCMKNIPGYVEAFGQELENPSGTQTQTFATCPAGTVPYGGGGLATSASNLVSLNSSIPTSTGWRTDVNNNSGGDDFAQSYALCGTQLPGYQLVVGTPKTVQPGKRAGASVACRSGTTVLSGGGFSNSGSVVVQLSSTLPNTSTGWTADENNNNSVANTVTAEALCATIT